MREELVEVASFIWPLDADIAKSRLEADGIACFVFDEGVITMNWLYANAVWGVKLFVGANDLERAKEILGEESISTTDEDERCPSCNSANLEYKNLYKKWLFLSWLLIGIPLPFFKNRWVCKECGYTWAEEDMM